VVSAAFIFTAYYINNASAHSPTLKPISLVSSFSIF